MKINGREVKTNSPIQVESQQLNGPVKTFFLSKPMDLKDILFEHFEFRIFDQPAVKANTNTKN